MACTTFNWEGLPSDIQAIVLKAMTEKDTQSVPKTKTYPLTTYSLVCKDWQNIFEGGIWRRLVLTQSSLPDFERIIRLSPHRKGHIRNIHLRIELQRYTCTTCTRFKQALQEKLDQKTFQEAILRLFSILSSWERGMGTPLVTGLLVEVSAISSSDVEHTFQADAYLDADDFSQGIHAVQTDVTEPHNPWHGWSHGQRTEPPRLAALYKLFCNGLFPDFRDQPIPQVPVIQTLLIRRQTRRMIGIEALQGVLQSLPRLETLVFEPWRTFWRSTSWGYDVDKGMYGVPFSYRKPNQSV